ncbi:MAG: AAA family ATPase, partial [Bacteroidales bacterium]|nr:AAA family ATPase [Bacteroidales bacterium]
MDTKEYKSLPYGNSNFERLIEENYAYVDKTRFIELLEKESNSYLFFTRPRKFGKSLFFSMLSHYYDINGAGKFETLFGDLYIGKHPTSKKNTYAVMEFDFSGLDTTSGEDFRDSFASNVQDTVRDFLRCHNNIFAEAELLIKEIDAEKSGVTALRKTYSAAKSAGIKIFVIIDEYDHFANDLIAMGTSTGDDLYRNMVRANGSVRDFYETLKAGSKTVIDRILLTGITPIMLDDLTSGFNISNNLSLDPIYNEMLGFTQEEVNWLMEATGVDKSLIDVDMEFLYNGYLFHGESEHKVYNPSMILYFFDHFQKRGNKVEYIVDENLKTDYGRLRRLVQKEQNRKQLMEITQEGGIYANIILKFSIEQLHDNKYFISLLFYMGLLTIDRFDRGRLRLKIPNYSIRTVYWEYIMRLTKERNTDIHMDYTAQNDAIWELAYNVNPAPFIEYMSQNIISRMSNRDLQNFDEKLIKLLLLNSLFQSRLFVPITEMEVTHGYTDIYLKRSHLLPDIPCEWVWEVKYVKKSDEENNA